MVAKPWCSPCACVLTRRALGDKTVVVLEAGARILKGNGESTSSLYLSVCVVISDSGQGTGNYVVLKWKNPILITTTYV